MERVKGYLTEVTAPQEKLINELVSEGKHHGVQDFQLGLDLLLDGLERLRKTRSQP